MKLKKFIAVLCATMIISTQAQAVHGKVIHEITQEQTVTRGVTHIQKQILTSSGWQDVNLLRINLDDDNVKLGIIEDEKLGEKETITNLAIEAGAVAAVNADYFDMSATSAPAFGPVVEDGKLYHAYNNEYGALGPKKHMATFIVDQENNPMLGYYSLEMKMVSSDTYLFDINSYNKLVGNLHRPVIIDGTYYPNNQEVINKYKETGVYTVLIKDQEITYVSQLNEVVPIDKDTMGLILNPETFTKNSSYLQEGNEVELRTEIILNNQVIDMVENLSMSIGGGGIIMKDGKPYTGAAHQVSGDKKEPRTILATTNNKSEVLLLTVDGRGKSIGANHQDLTQILQQLGVKDAMYLDGGGSTTMSVRDEGSTQVTLQNKPSGIVERKVANGIGIFSTNTPGNLDKLIIQTSKERTFVGEPVKIEVKGIDEYGNPLKDLGANMEISVAGVSGKIDGMTFYPESEGKALIMVTVGDATGTVEMDVTKPVALFIEPTTLQIEANSSKNVQIYGVDKDGYKTPIDPTKITWESPIDSIKAQGNKITAQGNVVTKLTADYQGAKGDLNVVVGETVVKVESFEENTAKWSGTGATVEGKVEPSKEVKYHGDQALKMTYTFDKDTNRQIGYTVFNSPIALPSDTKSVNMWLNARGQGDTVKIQIEDANGKVHYLKVADKLDFTGWKYVGIPIPEEVAMPAKLTKLYVYADSNIEKRTSALYIDHISVTRGIRDEVGVGGRQDNLFDPMYKESLQAPVGNQYSIKVTGPTAVNGMKLSNETVQNITDNLNKDAEVTVKASTANLDMNLNAPISYKGQFGLAAHKDIDFIFAGTGKGSLRTHNEDEWELLKQSLESSDANHILLVMGHNPLTQFNDAREGQALHDYLVEYKDKTGKDLFVITTGGLTKEVCIEEGIRYIRLNGLHTATDQVQETEYLAFKVVGDEIYYTFEPMVSK